LKIRLREVSGIDNTRNPGA